VRGNVFHSEELGVCSFFRFTPQEPVAPAFMLCDRVSTPFSQLFGCRGSAATNIHHTTLLRLPAPIFVVEWIHRILVQHTNTLRLQRENLDNDCNGGAAVAIDQACVTCSVIRTGLCMIHLLSTLQYVLVLFRSDLKGEFVSRVHETSRLHRCWTQKIGL